MTRSAVCMFLTLALPGFAQEKGVQLRGLSVYAGDDDSYYPIVVRTSVDHDGKPLGRHNHLTIQFDVLADEPPDLQIRFFHCNRDWVVDDNLFVNDNNHNTSFTLRYVTSPGGVIGYTYRYINTFPDGEDAVRFDYSGNWIFRIMNKDQSTVLADGRFFVVDDITPTSVLVVNDYLTANVSPFNQIQKVVARVQLPQEVGGFFYTTADVYQNRRFHHPYRIDMWDRDPYTHVDGLNSGERVFRITNILPGNDYRMLDLSNATRYPNWSLVRPAGGADQLRPFWRTGTDRNGEATLNRFTGLNSDYLDVLFRLDMTAADYRALTAGARAIYLAGPFNFWNPTEKDKLERDDAELAYVLRMQLRRGIYDYQYVTGVGNPATGEVTDQDWIAIEGNDWRTTNRYTVFIYFNDPRFGGFDRIVGMGIGNSVQTVPGTY